MSAGVSLITAEEFAEMYFDVPVELVRGEIVCLYGEDGMTRPGPDHGGVCFNIGRVIDEWARSKKAGRVATNDSWVTTERDPDTTRGPDVAYYRMESLPDGKLPGAPNDIVPNLCAEVLSPSNRSAAVEQKKSEFLAAGCEEVWVADPAARTVTVHRSDREPMTYSECEVFSSLVLPGLTIDVSAFFDGI